MKVNTNIYKYKKKNVIIISICLVVLILSYSACFLWENVQQNDYVADIVNYTLEQSTDPAQDQEGKKDRIRKFNKAQIFISYIKEICAISISLLITAFITMLVLEKNEKETIYRSALNDFFDDSCFKFDMSNLPKLGIISEKELASNNIPEDMVSSVISKVCNPTKPFYYTDLSISIDCTIKDNYIEKDIIKTMKIRSYSNDYLFEKTKSPFIIVRMCCGKLDSKKPQLEVIDVKLTEYNGKYTTYSKKNFKISKENVYEKVNKKIGYTKFRTAYFPENIKIDNEHDTIIEIHYITRVPLDDLSYGFRLPCACKNFKSTFKLLNKRNDFRISGHAFGFQEDAIKTMNNDETNSLSFAFEDWIFCKDGIMIDLIKKQK